LEELDKDLATLLKEADDCIIYIAYGSVLSGHKMPESKRNAIVDALKRLGKERGIKAIWKWESEEMQGKPDNVLLKKWLPQQDLIGHNKTKIFVTHGGMMSTMESLYHGKPMIVMPGFADQVNKCFGK